MRFKHLLLFTKVLFTNSRINRCKSDMLCYPNCCDFPKHFLNANCSCETDLSVPVLEKVTGFESFVKYKGNTVISPKVLSIHSANFIIYHYLNKSGVCVLLQSLKFNLTRHFLHFLSK